MQFAHTHFSLRYGTMSPEELLGGARQRGITRLVVTDINNTSACHDLLRLAPNYGIELSIGVDFRNGAERMFVAAWRTALDIELDPPSPGFPLCLVSGAPVQGHSRSPNFSS